MCLCVHRCVCMYMCAWVCVHIHEYASSVCVHMCGACVHMCMCAHVCVCSAHPQVLTEVSRNGQKWQNDNTKN